MAVRKDMVSGLRARLTDDRASVPAFSLAATAPARSALLEITNGYLNVTVEGGEGINTLRWNLSLPQFATVGKVVDALARERGYEVVPDVSLVRHHLAYDLRVDGIADIAGGRACTLRHYIFSDSELLDLLEEACTAHNPNYTVNTVPAAERHYVLLKAQALGYMRLAADASKRKGLDQDAGTFLQLAKATEEQYANDRKALARIIPSPKMDESTVGQGDAMQGTLTRRSLRRGYTTPYRGALPPQPPELFDPADDDIEDTTIRLRWTQNRDEKFVAFEIWRDTQGGVDRSISGRLSQAWMQQDASGGIPVNTQYTRQATAKQVFGTAESTPNDFFFSIAAEAGGVSIINNAFIDGIISSGVGALGEPLEPQTDYYYKVYAVNWNGEIVGSNVRRYHTKPMRARFKRDGAGNIASDAMSVHTGPIAGGTLLTVLATNIVDGAAVFIGGKKCTEVSHTTTTLVVTSPAFTNTDFIGRSMDVVLQSPTGLKDILMRGWEYTA